MTLALSTSTKMPRIIGLSRHMLLWVQFLENKAQKHSFLDLQQQCEHPRSERQVANDTEGIDIVEAIHLKEVVEDNGSDASTSTNETVDGAHALWVSKWDNS